MEKKNNNSNHGINHWKLQRLSAVVIIPLVFWFLISLLFSMSSSYLETIEWLEEIDSGEGEEGDQRKKVTVNIYQEKLKDMKLAKNLLQDQSSKDLLMEWVHGNGVLIKHS